MGIRAWIMTKEIDDGEGNMVWELLHIAPGSRTPGTPEPSTFRRDRMTYVEDFGTTVTPMDINGFFAFPGHGIEARTQDTAIYDTGIAKDGTGVKPALIAQADSQAKFLLMLVEDENGDVVAGYEKCHRDSLIADYPDQWDLWLVTLDARNIFTRQQMEQWVIEQEGRPITFREVAQKVKLEMARM